jgi:hypothetical protein
VSRSEPSAGRVRTLNYLRILFSVSALVLIVFGLFTMREASRTRGWLTADGRVVSAGVNEFTAPDGSRTYRPMVIFAYSVNSIRYMSNHISFGSTQSSSRSRAAHYGDRYPAGSHVVVHYDPVNPEHAVLETAGNPWIPIGAGGACSMLALWMRIRRGPVQKKRR